MTYKIAINGFGRIGRLVYRVLLERNMLDGKVEVVAVNDLTPVENLAYLLEYDSVHGKLNMPVEVDGDTIKVGEHSFKALSQKVTPKELPWSDLDVDLVIESTGVFKKKEDSMGHIEAGAKKVLISAPSEDVKTILIGVNDEDYNGEDIVSNASCTTNCLGPIVKVIQDSGIKIKQGLMTTVHAYTASQNNVDGTSKKDMRLGRAGAQNIIPTTTGAAKAIHQIFPELKLCLNATAIRVPVIDSSMIDLTFESEKPTSLEEINSIMKEYSKGELKGILDYTEEPVVSTDFIHNRYSATYDATASMQLNDRFFKLIAWYDNEWGYSSRLVDLLDLVTRE